MYILLLFKKTSSLIHSFYYTQSKLVESEFCSAHIRYTCTRTIPYYCFPSQHIVLTDYRINEVVFILHFI